MSLALNLSLTVLLCFQHVVFGFVLSNLKLDMSHCHVQFTVSPVVVAASAGFSCDQR